MEQSPPLIELKDLWKTYELGKLDLTVLHKIDLKIEAGRFVVILGPSGSGKSTLLNIIGLLDVPSRGKVLFEGKDTSVFSEDQLAEMRGRKIGFVFQQFNLLQHLSAQENVMVPMLFQGKSEKQRKKRAEELLDSVGLKPRMSHRPSELSGGEQQRVAIARALANEPDIIVADEPTGNLDSSTGKRIMDLLVGLHQEDKKTVIVVTHDPTIAENAQDIVSIKDGKLQKNHKKAEKFMWEDKK